MLQYLSQKFLFSLIDLTSRYFTIVNLVLPLLGVGYCRGRDCQRLWGGLPALRGPRADLPQVLEQGEDRGPGGGAWVYFFV